jgi:NitT/TauT family transport system ATP-binding protein
VEGLRVVDIHKSFPRPASPDRRLAVLDGLTFAVSSGEIVSVIGPSGCGKTTLLRVIGGLDSPDSGSRLLNGLPILGPRTDIAIVFQSFNLFPWRTAYANVEFGLQMLRVRKQERMERVQRLLSFVGLTGFEHYYPAQLSGGMQQRVGLARALAVNPTLLLMDEPFGSLDYQTADRLREELLRIQSETRKMILLITHNIDEALSLSDRILVLSKRPAKVIEEISPSFADKRREIDVHAHPEFHRLRTLIKHLVMEHADEIDRA